MKTKLLLWLRYVMSSIAPFESSVIMVIDNTHLDITLTYSNMFF